MKVPIIEIEHIIWVNKTILPLAVSVRYFTLLCSRDAIISHIIARRLFIKVFVSQLQYGSFLLCLTIAIIRRFLINYISILKIH